MTFFNRNFKSLLLGIIMMVSAVTGLSSCGVINDDLDPCPQGLVLRFVYDYNMEFVNAFPSQVHCLTVLVYDEQGRYVTTRNVTTRADLSDENWRMTLDLPAGRYKLLAYGGMACDDRSFHFVNDTAVTALQQLQVAMNPAVLTSPKGTQLHNLFYGFLEVEVVKDAMDYNYYTVYMMRDTNDVRIVLQELNGDPVDDKNFDFSIVDDNTLMGWNNDVIPTATTVYCPWAQGQASTGILPETDSEITVAYAEFSIGRLVTANQPRLRVTLKSDGSEVIDIPLINYLLLLKSERYASMGNQEFLDRENRWSMIFFLDRHWKWVKTHIVINDWTVRINDITGF